MAKTRRIEISPGEFEVFDVIPFDGKVGDNVWFYDDDQRLIKATIRSIDPDSYYITATGKKKLGSVQCVWDEGTMHCGSFLDFDEVMLDEPDSPDKQQFPAMGMPGLKWTKCTDEDYNELMEKENDGALLIAFHMSGEWFYYNYYKGGCPYGWNILCKGDAYYMFVAGPVVPASELND